MQRKKGKHLVSIIICLALIAASLKIGSMTGLLGSYKQLFSAKFDLECIIPLMIMICLVIAVEKLFILFISSLENGHQRMSTIVAILSSLARYTAAIIMLCWGLAILGVDVSTITASVGIVALIVGFGAESLIQDVITGIFMLFENQYDVGDIVEVSGFRGTVTDIGIRTTCITDAGGNVKIINNSDMKDILNRSNKVSIAVSDIEIPYETDLEALEEKFSEITQGIYDRHPDVFKQPPVYKGVQTLGPSGIALRFIVEVEERNIYNAQRELNRELLLTFKKAGVEVPFPQLDIHQK